MPKRENAIQKTDDRNVLIAKPIACPVPCSSKEDSPRRPRRILERELKGCAVGRGGSRGKKEFSGMKGKEFKGSPSRRPGPVRREAKSDKKVHPGNCTEKTKILVKHIGEGFTRVRNERAVMRKQGLVSGTQERALQGGEKREAKCGARPQDT